MPVNIIDDSKRIMETAKRILLVDWPHPGVPRALLKAGFTVFCYSPDHYSTALMVKEYPNDVNQKNIFPPLNKDEGYLVFRELDSAPGSVDVVNVYRPEEEHAEIIAKHVLPLNAKILWLQPPVKSANTKSLAKKHNLIFVEGRSITEMNK